MGKMITLGVIGFLAVGLVMATLGFRTDCIGAEAGIKAQYSQNQNNYDNMWKSFRELAQVPKMQEAALEKLYKSTTQARYGEEGSKAMFQFITEQNPNLDQSTFTRLQAAIEAGRKSFAADQQQLIAKKEQYEKLLGSTRALVANIFLSFPRIDLSKYDIVTSGQTQDAFNTKKVDEVKLTD